MFVLAIALYMSSSSGICSMPHHSYQIPHSPFDFNLNPRPPCSSTASSSSAQKSITESLSRLFSSPATRHVGSFSSSFIGADELSSLWHNQFDNLSSSFCYSSYPMSSLKCRYLSPVLVFQGPVSCSGSVFARSLSLLRTTHDWSSSDWTVGKDRIFSGFIRNALGSCLDFNSPRRKGRRRKRLRSMASMASWEGGTDGLMKTKMRPTVMEKCEGREDSLVVSDGKDEEGEREIVVVTKFAKDLATASWRRKMVGFAVTVVKEEKAMPDGEGRGRRDRGLPMEEIWRGGRRARVDGEQREERRCQCFKASGSIEAFQCF